MTSTRQVRNYFCHTMQQVENRIGDHTFHELFDTWLNGVKAEAWDEGYQSSGANQANHENWECGVISDEEYQKRYRENPYRKDEE